MSFDITPSNDKIIAVIGATGQQGGAMVRALQADGQFPAPSSAMALESTGPSAPNAAGRNPSGEGMLRATHP